VRGEGKSAITSVVKRESLLFLSQDCPALGFAPEKEQAVGCRQTPGEDAER
jgi:hypothetical protein